MIGGADPTDAEGVASDIEIIHNHIHKPAYWNQNDPTYNGYNWVIKNLFEIKHGKRWLIEGNIFENNWQDAQTGQKIYPRY
jgi:alpha-N-acetylglucosamine transferase